MTKPGRMGHPVFTPMLLRYAPENRHGPETARCQIGDTRLRENASAERWKYPLPCPDRGHYHPRRVMEEIMANIDDPSPSEVLVSQREVDARADAATSFASDSTWDSEELEERVSEPAEKPWQLRRRERHSRWI